MILVKPSFKILTKLDGQSILQFIEEAGRTCYKSEDKITSDSRERFVATIIKSGHHSVLEHEDISVRIICDRGVTHEIVRHRLVAYSQESTRYCNYKGGVTFVIPPWIAITPGEWSQAGSYILPINPPRSSHHEAINDFGDVAMQNWLELLHETERVYVKLLNQGWSPQQARSVLPNSLKTEIVMTANIREWRHILTLRTSKAAHPQMREIMIPLLEELKGEVPVLFGDINPE